MNLGEAGPIRITATEKDWYRTLDSRQPVDHSEPSYLRGSCTKRHSDATTQIPPSSHRPYTLPGFEQKTTLHIAGPVRAVCTSICG